MNKICKACGEEFIQISNNQKYCSQTCSKKVHEEQCKKYKQNHKKEHNEYNKQYRREHEKTRIYQKEYNKKYRLEHVIDKEIINEKQRNFRKNPINRLISNYRNIVWSALKRNVKSAHTIELLGCSVENFKIHLENKFTKGMTWKNYGKWHVDHIRPCASFDLSKKEEQFKCFNYKNLQPLWATENLEKNDKYELTTGENNG